MKDLINIKSNFICPITKVEFVHISGGRLSCNSKDDSVKIFIVKSFYISKYLVTQIQWKNIITDYKVLSGQENYPVAVDLHKANDFIRKINKTFFSTKTILRKKNNSNNNYSFDIDRSKIPISVYRLPTEQEWEFSAKGGDLNHKWSGTNKLFELVDFAWFDQDYDCHRTSTYPGGLLPFPVGQKKPNIFGLYDMSGNVAEFVAESEGSIGNLARGGWLYDSAEEITTYCRGSYSRRSRLASGDRGCGFRLTFSAE